LFIAATLPALAQPTWNVTNTLHIGGEGDWDYVTVDAATHRLFVTRSTHTVAIDAATGAQQRRPRPKPGTFMIVEVGQSGN